MSGRDRPAENSLLTKHVVAAGKFAQDPGSTPGASTILRSEHAVVRAEDGALRSFSEGGLVNLHHLDGRPTFPFPARFPTANLTRTDVLRLHSSEH